MIVDKKPKIVSALEAVEKSNGYIRIINDCSQPSGQALNDYATIQPSSYQTIQDALNAIGPGGINARLIYVQHTGCVA